MPQKSWSLCSPQPTPLLVLKAGAVGKLGKGATVADVGCGHGHSTVLMAKAYPNSRFWGFDAHEDSIATARRVADKAGVADHVTFDVAKADNHERRGYDLICFFDALHDMGRPVDAVRHAAGAVMLVEPFARDRVEDNINPIGRLYCAASSTMCCAHAISEKGTHVLGAQAGPRQLEAVLQSAGFATVRKVAETPFRRSADFMQSAARAGFMSVLAAAGNVRIRHIAYPSIRQLPGV